MQQKGQRPEDYNRDNTTPMEDQGVNSAEKCTKYKSTIESSKSCKSPKILVSCLTARGSI